MRYSFLSHEYSKQFPVFGEAKELAVKQLKSVTAGDSCNSFSTEIQSHWGTHIDAPHHFFADGKSITHYPADFFVFNAPQTIQIALKPSEMLNIGSLKTILRENCDLLLIKSDWTKFRSQPVYYQSNPGISPEFARSLRNDFPKLRAIGIDWISISAFQYRDMGRESHRILLDPEGFEAPKLLIEDLNLSTDLHGLLRVIVAPIRVSAFDSAPCTVIGEWND